MSQKFSVRQMKENETVTVATLWNKLSYNQLSRDIFYEKDHKLLLKANNISYFENCFANPNCFIFVAEYNSEIIGFSELWFYKKDFFFNIEDYAYVLHLFVDTEVKTNINPLSIPCKLCQVCEEKALEFGYKYIGGDVFEFNKEMQIFLKARKYEPYRARYIKCLKN